MDKIKIQIKEIMSAVSQSDKQLVFKMLSTLLIDAGNHGTRSIEAALKSIEIEATK